VNAAAVPVADGRVLQVVNLEESWGDKTLAAVLKTGAGRRDSWSFVFVAPNDAVARRARALAGPGPWVLTAPDVFRGPGRPGTAFALRPLRRAIRASPRGQGFTRLQLRLSENRVPDPAGVWNDPLFEDAQLEYFNEQLEVITSMPLRALLGADALARYLYLATQA